MCDNIMYAKKDRKCFNFDGIQINICIIEMCESRFFDFESNRTESESNIGIDCVSWNKMKITKVSKFTKIFIIFLLNI